MVQHVTGVSVTRIYTQRIRHHVVVLVRRRVSNFSNFAQSSGCQREPAPCDMWTSIEDLQSLPRHELQSLAKARGIRANSKNTKLIEDLLAWARAASDGDTSQEITEKTTERESAPNEREPMAQYFHVLCLTRVGQSAMPHKAYTQTRTFTQTC